MLAVAHYILFPYLVTATYLGADIGPRSRYLVITPYIHMHRGADIVVDMRGVAINNFFLLNILLVK